MLRAGLTLVLLSALNSPVSASDENIENPTQSSETLADEISTLQGQVMNQNDVVANERMLIANIERNIEEVRLSNERRAQELANETDPQRRAYLQEQIDGWNRWVQNDMYSELNERNSRLNSALTSILSLQERINQSERLLSSVVQETLNNTESSNEEKIEALESYNRALEYTALARSHESQKQIFLFVALKRQTESMSPGNRLYTSMLEASKSLELASNKTAEVYIAQNMLIQTQNEIIAQLKNDRADDSNEENFDPKDKVKKALEYLQQSKSDTKISIDEKLSALSKMEDLLQTLDSTSEDYRELVDAIELLRKMIEESKAKMSEILELENQNNEIIEELRSETLLDRASSLVQDSLGLNSEIQGEEALLKVSGKRNKLGKFVAAVPLVDSSEDFLKVKNNEIDSLEVIAVSGAKTLDVDLSIKAGKLSFTFNKKPRAGTYKLQLESLSSEETDTVEIVIAIKTTKSKG
jgi:hypothetical protein